MRLPALLLTAAVTAFAGVAAAAADEASAPPAAAALINTARPHHVFLIGMLRVTQPWVDVANGASGDVSGYLIVENRSAVPDRLMAASLQGVAAVSIVGGADGQGLVIPPNATVMLQPGAVHLALHGAQGLSPHGPIAGALRFERSGMLHLDFATDRAEAIQDDQTTPSSEDRAVDLAH